jgi:drug/metabolite transporter (DMT)-like permease
MVTRTKPLHLVVLLLLAVVYSAVGIAMKSASSRVYLSIPFCFWYFMAILALAIYAICWQAILTKVDLLVAYAARGTSILWTLLWAWLIFGEAIRFSNIIGGLMIIIGITLVGLGDK